MPTLSEIKTGDIVRLKKPKNPFMLVSSVNPNTKMVLVKTITGPKVYDYKDLILILTEEDEKNETI